LRDIALAVFILGLAPLALKRPWIGVLMYVWVSVMNVQYFGYSVAAYIPFAAIIAIVTMVGMVTTKEEVGLPLNATTWLLLLFPLWMCLTYAVALEHQADGYHRWKEVMKIFFFLLISASILKSRKHIDWLIWVIVISVGFYGVKGGLFTIASGGSYRVWGPPGNNAITDNNSISVALVMMIPLMFYLRTIVNSKWIQWGLWAAIGLSTMAILGTHSRGALLAVTAMIIFLWLKSDKKFLLGIFLVLAIPLAIGFMPAKWIERMKSIESYEQDGSAMGRINAWKMAINVANDRPLVGGGFELYTPRTFAKYSPNPLDVHAAHSIYFQMLGEHGYVGLGMFLLLGFIGWVNASRVIRKTRDHPEHKWAGDLSRMIQVSLVGYAVGGLFVNIGYWEIFYYLLIALVVMNDLVSPQEKGLVVRKTARPVHAFSSD
jgi:putative inorganic carbon (hco3(-)) transporter